MSRYSGPPMTLGNAAAARVRLIVWCLDCQHQVEPDPVEMAERYGAEMTVPDWHKRLVCGQRGGRRVEFVATGARRRHQRRQRTPRQRLPGGSVSVRRAS